jgi:hypothetical protein
MGSIYAQAVLTVFAVIGDDPSYGLPGVTIPRERYPNLNQTGLQDWWNDIYSSTWIKRGWTMQESYLSKRRLFITQSQVIFGCNRHTCLEEGSEHSEMSFPDVFGPGLSRSYLTDTETTEGLVSSYSSRLLRRDDDALNAITGILVSPTRIGSIHRQFWCVPFDITEQPSELVVSLYWKTLRRGQRRADFPSWSPLGWTSRIAFSSDRRQGRVGIVYGSELEVFINKAWLPWATLATPENQAIWIKPPLESRILRITASTFRLPVAWKKAVRKRYDDSSLREEKKLYLKVSHFLREPYWDTAPESLESGDEILCAEIHSQRKQVLLLKSKSSDESYYERVGTFDWYVTGPRSTERWDGSFDSILNEEALRTRQTRTFLLA